MRQRGRRMKGMEEAHLFVGMTQINTNRAFLQTSGLFPRGDDASNGLIYASFSAPKDFRTKTCSSR